MKVRNRMFRKTEFLGQATLAYDELCPCRSCYRPHDCGSRSAGHWVPKITCVTRYNLGCPDPLPKPQHVLRKRSSRVCKRCGKHLTAKEIKETRDDMEGPA